MRETIQISSSNSNKIREVLAVIMFADIIDSSKYARFGGLSRYNRMVREFHQTAQETIDTYSSMKITDEQFERQDFLWALRNSKQPNRATGHNLIETRKLQNIKCQ